MNSEELATLAHACVAQAMEGGARAAFVGVMSTEGTNYYTAYRGNRFEVIGLASVAKAVSGIFPDGGDPDTYYRVTIVSENPKDPVRYVQTFDNRGHMASAVIDRNLPPQEIEKLEGPSGERATA